MNKTVSANVLRRAGVLLIAMLMLLCAVAVPQAEAADFKASYIEKLDKGDVKVDTEKYFDSNVVYQLPDSVKDDDEISVIITLDVITLKAAYDKSDKKMTLAEFVLNSDEAKEIREKIENEKAEILETLDQKAISYKVGVEYDTLIAGFELLIKAGDLNVTTKAMPADAKLSVGEQYKPAKTELVENKVSVYETGIFDSSSVKFDGTGMVVAVLDTGIDYAHSAFSPDNFKSNNLGLTYEQVAALMDKTTASKLSAGLTADDVYINEKIPFSFDYADADPDAYSDHNNHGTHVSGIICGKDDTITGVAPNAQLVSMKVFSSIMDTARSAWILSALEDCVVLGVDVINMSLGTSAGFASPSMEEVENGVYDDIRESGISLIVAASNSYAAYYGSTANGNLGLTSNPDSGTVGSPGTYLPALSVASINGVKTPYLLYGDTIMYFSQTTNGASEENDFLETLLGDKESMEIDFVLIPGVGRSADYTGIDVKGKIALVRRGDNTFEEKAIIAQNQGAAGIIIYNNVSGDIKMNVGDAKLAACSISQDMGEILAEAGSGTIKVAYSQKSGPFIDDFSSWGPTPSLGIKPEITAHGGNILSAVTGGDYDRMSGTSMATPNVAGLSLLLRQYIVENFPEIANDSVAVNTLMNQLMMSTADIILNKNGLPYAVRKQGAGLANLDNCVNTDAIIITYDEDGKAMDKTKLELKDDPSKTGVYKMSFTVKNFGSNSLSYDLGAYVLTEGVSETLTAAGKTTVTENAYVLEGAKLEFTADGAALADSKLTVAAGKEVKVTATITLSDADKKYLDDSFENGMYVEGYITLKATSGTEVDMNVPYLAFYGDWTKAPLLDKDYFETDKYERDETLPLEDKNLPDGWSTRPVATIQSDYYGYLGSYYFVQKPGEDIISANRDYVALSNQEGTLHDLKYIWAGMLRNAAKVVVTITDDTTGEVVYEVEDDYIRKSYGDGGMIRPQQIEIDFDVMAHNLPNNTTYTVKMVGYMDYGNGGLETNENNTFEFPLTTDFQAPPVEDVEFYYESDKTLKKNRLYAKIAVYDNHYAMAFQPGCIVEGEEGPTFETFDQYMTAIRSQKDSTTYVTYELTDHVYHIKENAYNANSFMFTVYDYAMNCAYYEIGLPDNFTDFYFEGLPEDGLTMSPNETFSMEPMVYPNTEWAELLQYRSSNPNVVRVVNNKLVAVKDGKARISVTDPATNKRVDFTVTVLKEGDEGYQFYSKPVADVFDVPSYYTVKAYMQMDSADRDIGQTTETRYFFGNHYLAMYPSESVLLNVNLAAYFPNETKLEFESGNEDIVKIDSNGLVTAVAEGFSSVTVKVMQDGKSTPYAMTITVEVKDPFINTGASLTHYFGNGGVVSIPADLHLTSIGAFAFSNYQYGPKTEAEMEIDDSSSTKQVPIGDNTITKVIIPEGVERIDSYAFAMLTALEEVVLPSTLTEIAYYAFYGCENLEKISFSGENNLKLINYSAFMNCDLKGTLDLPRAYVVGDYAFWGNENLEGIHLPETLQSIGTYAFAGCKKLKDVTVTAPTVKYGPYAFTGCAALESFTVNASLIPAGMFYQCENLTDITIGASVNAINEYAFRETAITEFKIASGNTAFKVQNAAYVLSADGKTLVAVGPNISGEFTVQSIGGANVTALARGAFSHNTKLNTVKLPGVTNVGAYAFAGDEADKNIKTIELGKLSYIGEYAFSATGISQTPAFDANTVMGKYAFLMSDVTSVTIPDGMIVPEGAFSRCKNLSKVTVGNDVVLGDFAFYQDYLDCMQDPVKTTYEGLDIFYVTFGSKLNSVTIGNNVTIGASAFAGAFDLESVTLGENAVIGNQAFYNCESLKNIDLSKVQTIGKYAFSGDVFNMFFDSSLNTPAYGKDNMYMYTYHAPKLESVDLSSAVALGEYAFATCQELKDVKLNPALSEIPAWCFAQTPKLENIDLSKIASVGEYAFRESGIAKVDLSAANIIGQYAFMDCENLNDVTLSAGGTQLSEAAFAYCPKLEVVGNMDKLVQIGDYAFAYTGIVKADLSSAVSIGEAAFLKDQKTTFEVVLGSGLNFLGDNPFAGSVVAPFYMIEKETFNGVEYENKNYSFQYGENVYVIDGSLYLKVANGGLVLITYAGENHKDVQVADGTVRIGSMAFAYSDVKMVTMPHTVMSIGHKAFFACEKLSTVVFSSFQAPTLEEEFDASHFESFENFPGTGIYGNYQDIYTGENMTFEGLGMVPYFMWNIESLYSNVFYGANFVDYVGHVDNKLLMVRPSNGQKYETFMYGQYFDLVVDGGAAMDDNTLKFLEIAKQLPERITLQHKSLVEAARAAYNKLTTTEQRGLVESYYNTLTSAEQRIKALEEAEQGGDTVVPPVEDPTEDNTGLIVGIVAAVVVIAGVAAAVVLGKKRKAAPAEEAPAAEEAEETEEAEVEATEEAQAEAEEETTNE